MSKFDFINKIEERNPFLQVLILICIGLVASVVLGSIAVSLYSSFTDVNLIEYPLSMSKEQPILFMIVNQVPFQVGMFLIPGLIYRQFQRSKSNFQTGNALWGVVLFGVMVLLLPFLTEINTWVLEKLNMLEGAMQVKSQSDSLIENLVSGQETSVFISTLIVIGIITGFAEEFFFRGFVYDHLAVNSGNKWLAIVVSASFFAVLHFNYVQILPLLSFGVALALIYEFSGSIYLGAALHALNNVLNLYWLYTEDYPSFMEDHNWIVTSVGLGALLVLLFLKRTELSLKA
ncbi:MAG: CPBP family intramembrane glutamic endopeptidase [Lishizhenia sp.]|nr:CPBP family intramembrane glutamic endopeptidase [Lishizhenia sp.]